MIEYLPALRDYLIDDPAISGVVGDRIFPLYIPQGVGLPAIVWTIDGASREPRHYAGLVESFLDLELHFDADGQYGIAEALADSVRLRIDSFKGAMSSRDVEIRGIFLRDQIEQYVPPSDGKGAGVFVFTLEFTVWFYEIPARGCG